MRIGSKSENEFFLKLNKRNEIIQENFLKLINSVTKTVDTKVMLGDSTVKEINTFDPKNVESFLGSPVLIKEFTRIPGSEHKMMDFHEISSECPGFY